MLGPCLGWTLMWTLSIINNGMLMLLPFMAIHWWFKVHWHWARTTHKCTWAVKKSQRALVISHDVLTLCLVILWIFLCSFMFLVIPFSLKECLTSSNIPYSYVNTKSFSFLPLNTSYKKKPSESSGWERWVQDGQRFPELQYSYKHLLWV